MIILDDIFSPIEVAFQIWTADWDTHAANSKFWLLGILHWGREGGGGIIPGGYRKSGRSSTLRSALDRFFFGTL